MTPCQLENKRAISMSSRTPISMFITSCQPNGSYQSIQCHNVTGFCWCVDKQGNELAGTRQWGKPNCTLTGKLNFKTNVIDYVAFEILPADIKSFLSRQETTFLSSST